MFIQVLGRVAVKHDLSWSSEEAPCSHSGSAGVGGQAPAPGETLEDPWLLWNAPAHLVLSRIVLLILFSPPSWLEGSADMVQDVFSREQISALLKTQPTTLEG